MDHASIGRPARSTLEAVQRSVAGLADWNSTGTGRTLGLVEEFERARDRIARLVDVSPENLALVENTTEGLGLIAASISLEPGDNVVIPDIDFVSAALVWRQRQRRVGFEIRPVTTSGGAARMEDFARAVGSHTRAIVTSAVQEVGGDRVDLEGLVELAEAHGAYLIIDGIQEVGALSRSLFETPAHAYCAGGHKWLGSPFGLGFLYAHPSLLEVCEPAFYGYFNLREPERGWGAYLESRERSPFDDLEISQGARVFESGGMPNWLGAVGLRHAVEYILERGQNSIEAHVLGLSSLLREGLTRIGLGDYVLGREEPEYRSAIVTYGLPGGLDRERQLLEELETEGVFVSLRSASGVGGIRVSPYVENTPEDIELLLEITEKFVKEV